MALDRWVPYRNETAIVRCRLFCFAHAAGNAAFYRPLRRLIPPEIDFCPVEMPGRAARLAEAPFTSMTALMEGLRHVLQPLMSVPFAFFGHSIGAWVAHEAARQLRASDGRSAVHLFVSGRASPERGYTAPFSRKLRSDEDLLAILDRFGGTPPAILQYPGFMAALLPVLRADLALVDGYTIGSQDRINCPITAFGGADDAFCSGIQSWRHLTQGKFRSRQFPGGHFYFSPAADALAGEIIQDLNSVLFVHAAGGGSRL